jgi:hypothetical protein
MGTLPLRLPQKHKNTSNATTLVSATFSPTLTAGGVPLMQRAEWTGSKTLWHGAARDKGQRGKGGSTYSQLQEREQSLAANQDEMIAAVGVVSVTLLLACCRDISGQSLGLGKCPSYPAIEKLDLKKVGIRKLVQWIVTPTFCRKPHMASSICLRATIFHNPEWTLCTHCISKT